MGKSSAASISLPTDIAKEVDKMAKLEHKTRSAVIQDAIRNYIEQRKWQELQAKISGRARKLRISSDDDIERLVDEVRL